MLTIFQAHAPFGFPDLFRKVLLSLSSTSLGNYVCFYCCLSVFSVLLSFSPFFGQNSLISLNCNINGLCLNTLASYYQLIVSRLQCHLLELTNGSYLLRLNFLFLFIFCFFCFFCITLCLYQFPSLFILVEQLSFRHKL